MKKSIFLTLAACGGMLFAANDAKAQEAVVVEESMSVTEFDATPHYYNTWRDGWFLQLGAGFNMPFVETIKVDGRKSRHMTAAYNLGVGKWISPYLGWRFSGLYGAIHWEDNGLDRAKYATVNVDFMWDMFNSIGGVNTNRVFSIVPFIGLGGAFTWDFDSKMSNIEGRHGIKRNQWTLPVSAGIQLRLRLCKYVDFFAEGRAQFFGDNFNNYAYGRPIDINGSVIGGFTFNFGGKSFKTYDPTPYLAYINNLNGQVNDLRGELADCGNRLAAAEAQLPCPEAAPVVKDCPEVATPLFSTVRFSINSDRITDTEMVNVYNIAEWMKANPDAKIVIKGYADKNTGTTKYNMGLSKRRAEAVQKILVDKYGISSDRLTIEAEGSDVQPYSTNNWNRIVIFSEN